MLKDTLVLMVPAYQTLIGHVLWLNVLQDTFVLKENVFQ